MSNWKDKHCVGLVQFDFEAGGQFQIALKANEKVEIFKESSGWYKGQVIGRDAKGIFPVSFIEITTETPPTKRTPKPAPAAAATTAAATDKTAATAAAKPAAAAEGARRPAAAQKVAPKPDGAAAPAAADKPADTKPANGAADSSKPSRPVPAAPGAAAAAKPADAKKPPETPPLRNAPAPAVDTSAKSTPTVSTASTPTAKPVPGAKSPTASATPAATTPKAAVTAASPTAADKKVPPKPPARASDTKEAKRRAPSMDGPRPSATGGALISDEVKKTIGGSAEALYAEVSNCMREWDVGLKQALVAGNSLEYHRTKERMCALLELRSKVMSDAIPENKREELRQEIIQLIEGSRKMQEGYMVPRNPQTGEMADDRNTGVIELLGLHRVMYTTIKEEASSLLKAKAEARRAAGQHLEKMKGAKSALKRLKLPAGYLQLYLDVKMCIFSVGEATEVMVALYNNQDGRFITEDYVIQLTASGMPENRAKIGKLMTFYKDLEARDFDRDLWLVCKIFRKGVLVSDDKQKKASGDDGKALYRRPFGCACTSLSGANFDELIGKEYQPPNAAMTIYMPKEETHFYKIHEMIIKGDKNLEPAPRAKGVALGLTLLTGELKAVRAADAKRFGDEKDVPVTSKLDFPEVMNPGDDRNDFYVMLLGGTFLPDGKSSAKNLEIVVTVRNLHGDCLENCIALGSGDGGPNTEYRTTVYYHSNTPQYNELLCLKLSPDQLVKSHLFFTYWHVSSSKKAAPFAFSYLKLTTDVGAAVPDQSHRMETFKPFAKMELRKGCGEAGYLKTGAAAAKFGARGKEWFHVQTRLVSTKKTQNVTLHGLSQWRETEAKVVKEFLGTFHVIRDVHEFLKFARETFNAFFGMLAADKYEPVHEQVFKAILHSISLLHDRNVRSARAVLRSYIHDIFHEPAVHLTLLRMASKVLTAAKAAADVPEVVRLLCVCLHSLCKFVVKSRELSLAAGAKPVCDEKTYKAEVQRMFGALTAVAAMDSKSDNLKPAQTALVTSLPIALKVLKTSFTPVELGTVAKGILGAFPSNTQALNKLNFVYRLLKGTIGEDNDARGVVFPELLALLQVHLRSIDACSESTDAMDEIHLCLAILCRLFRIMERNDHVSAEKLYELTALIKDILNVVATTQRSQSGEVSLKPPSDKVAELKVDLVVDSLTVLWSILHSMTDAHFDRYFASLPKPELKLILARLLDISKTSIGLNLYPELWIVMTMLQLSTIATLHKNVAKPLTQWFSKTDADFAPELWQSYLELTLETIGCDPLQLDKFSTRKQKFIDERYGDLREAVIAQFPAMWKTLGPRAVQFAGVLVPVLFDLASNYPLHLKEFAVDIYFQLLCREFDASGQFGTVERHTIDSLYSIANHNQALGETFMTFLFTTLTRKFESQPKLNAAVGQEFLTHVKRMYDYMASLLRFPDTALYEDERNSVALKLIHYLETSGQVRKEMYTRYVQYLVDLHASLKNYVEAGVTQGLQIKMLEWTDEVLEPFANYPREPERARRERLYKSAIQFFVAGEDYERAIARCDELRAYYQFESFEYDKLAETLAWQSDYFRKIVTTERFYSSYFRVVYYGSGFTDELRDKEFVYRGVKLENVMDFTNRLKRKFPEAKILPSSDKPADDVLAAAAQVITITTLIRASEADLEECAGVAPVVLARAPTKPQPPLPALPGAKPDLKAQPSDAARDSKTAVGGSLDKTGAAAVSAAATAAAAAAKAAARLPAPVRKYRENDSIRAFYYARGIQKSKDKKPANEFKDLWVAKTFVFAAESFPATRRRIDIVERRELTLTPVQNALATMTNKNRELLERMDAVDAAPPTQPVDVGPLSMLLNGMIDAAVNGGTGKYIDAFLTPDFKAADDTAKRHQNELRQSLRDQIALLKRGLTVFAGRRSADLKGLNDHLNGFFDQMVKKTEAVVA